MQKIRIGTAVVTAASLLVCAAAFAKAPARPIVAVETGKLEGVIEGSTQAFRGIPFAAPPEGALRWKPPVAAKAWAGVRDAAQYGAACPQARDHKEAWAQVGPTSEDCLFLNVWRPKRAGRYPVMVFIHGGGFTYGAAGVPLYDGRKLAERGVVIVTLNYRMGRLGFFAHPALTREAPDGQLGNYGIMDQVAALQWVQRNIARFGGDAKNVTLFGESAGAGSVQLLMGSPVGAGLFQKAISQSGSGNSLLTPIRGGAVNAEALGERWTDSLGLKDATADQLRAIPLNDIIKNGRAFPFIDGKVVVRDPGDSFYKQIQMRIPLMIGANSNEGSLIGNHSEFARPVLGDAYPDLLAEYAKRPGSTPTSAALDLAEDALSLLPSMTIADWQAKVNPDVYGYNFDQVPVDERPGSLGSQHGGEMEYLFGNIPAAGRWDADDQRVSTWMGDYWVRFARTGNPNGGGAPVWPAVTDQQTHYLKIGAETRAAALTPLEKRVQALGMAKAIEVWSAGK